MFELQKNYLKAFGTEISDAQVQKYLRISKALEIDDNDAVWKMFILAERSIDILDDAPARIDAKLRECTERFDRFSAAYGTSYRQVITEHQAQYRADMDRHLASTKSAADSLVQASAASAVERLSLEVARSVQQVVRDVSGRQKARWIGTMAVLVAVVLLGVAGVGYGVGQQVGRSESLDEKAAEAWGNSPQGQLAHRLANAGSLETVAGCTGQGWQQTKGVCYPFAVTTGADKGRVMGWRIAR